VLVEVEVLGVVRLVLVVQLLVQTQVPLQTQLLIPEAVVEAVVVERLLVCVVVATVAQVSSLSRSPTRTMLLSQAA
jgi:hypothetical protein